MTTKKIPDYMRFSGGFGNTAREEAEWQPKETQLKLARRWVPVGAVGRLLKISPTGQIVMGGSFSSLLHDHEGAWSCTSGGSNQQVSTTIGSMGYTTVGHTHTIHGIVDWAEQTPSYLTLQLYKFVRGFFSCSGSQRMLEPRPSRMRSPRKWTLSD